MVLLTLSGGQHEICPDSPLMSFTTESRSVRPDNTL